MEVLSNQRQMGLSVIVPYLNEADGITECCKALDRYAKEVNFAIEIIYVDDGSTDNTTDIII